MILRHRRLLLFIVLLLMLPRAGAQDGGLLARINSLRLSLQLPVYALHPALNAAAKSHADWMLASGSISHIQDDGSGPRSRAQNAGYPSSWISENIYMGADAAAAWEFWVNSPIHYAGLTSPHYQHIGIGISSGGRRSAFVLVFGNSPGSSSANRAAPATAPPAIGIDDVGNIMHRVQPEDTLGDIALLYGYGWDDIPAMLELNEMSEADIERLEIGSIFLVPPQDGTFTPSPAPPATATRAAPTVTALPSPTASATAAASPAPLSTRALILRAPASPTPAALPLSASRAGQPGIIQMLLVVAIVIQAVIIAAAGFQWLRRFR